MTEVQSVKDQTQKLCISHISDVDGCVCAALIKSATKSKFSLVNYGNINSYLKRVENHYNTVYICDLGINETTIEELNRIRRFANVIYIDHHPINKNLLKKLKKIDVNIINDSRDCASIQTYNIFSNNLPNEAGLLACYAAISDRLENGPLASQLIKKYDRDFVLFESMLLSYGFERADIQFKKKVVRELSKFQYPHNIEDIPKLALEQLQKIGDLRNKLPSRVLNLGRIQYVEVEGGSSGVIANLILDVCEADIGLGYSFNKEKKIVDLSLRGKPDLKINLGKITAQLANDLGGTGGGHPKASGARIPRSKLMEFIKILNDHV